MSASEGADRHAVVTGLGLVSPLAPCRDEHLNRLFAGDTALAPLPRDHGVSDAMAFRARVGRFDARTSIKSRMLRKLLQRGASFAVAAAGQALTDAGIEPPASGMDQCGLYVGAGSLDLASKTFLPALDVAGDGPGQHFDSELFVRQGFGLIDPLFIVKGLPNGGLCGIAIEYRLRGPNLNVSSGASSGLQAVAAAVSTIQGGELDLIVTGAYDSLLHPETTIEHHLAGRLSSSRQALAACRPFDVERNGYFPGEGAAMLILESARHARARGAAIYGEITAGAETTGSGHTTTSGEALERAARLAVEAGCGRSPDVIFGDGLGTPEDDRRESEAVERLFGNHVPFTASTGALGFTGAAAGVFSLAHALAALRAQTVPPILGCQHQDPACRLSLVGRAEKRQLESALVWTSDRGQKNVALSVSRK